LAAEVQPSDPAPARAADDGIDVGIRGGIGGGSGGVSGSGVSRGVGVEVEPHPHVETAVETDVETDVETSWMVDFSRGDTSAFERIVKTYEPRIYQFLRHRIRDPGRAEDLTQDVFLRVYRARRGYRPTAKLRTWLYTIANRLALNELRALRRRRRIFAAFPPFSRGDGAREADAGGALDDLPVALGAFPRNPVVAMAEASELAEAIHGLVAKLPTSQRTAIELLSREHLSYAEIAAVMGVTVPAVRSLIVRARQGLRAGLGPYLDEGVGQTEARA
jgi:RNA polymerase sigma-70 factor (ECF subfamily)